MTENLSHNLEELFQEIVTKGRESGAVSQEAFHSTVEEVVETHRQLGEIHDDESTEGMSEQLKNRWPDYSAALGLDEKNPQL
jgi:hypothetical protein